MLPPDTYKDRTVFITGGGTGLGKGMATKFSELGANVVIAARRLPVLEETAADISKLTGNKVLPVQCDIRDPAAIKAAVDACVTEFGLPHVIVHNAAGNFISPTERLSPNAFKTVIDIVLNGTAYLTLDVGKAVPFRTISITVLKALGDSLSVGEIKLPAALCTITCGRPNSVTQASTADLMAAGSLISHCIGNTLFPVNLEMSAAVSSKTGSLLAAMTTFAPNSLNLVAMPLPRPVPPPVMKTVRSL